MTGLQLLDLICGVLLALAVIGLVLYFVWSWFLA